jgi:hypothetical protein
MFDLNRSSLQHERINGSLTGLALVIAKRIAAIMLTSELITEAAARLQEPEGLAA